MIEERLKSLNKHLEHVVKNEPSLPLLIPPKCPPHKSRARDIKLLLLLLFYKRLACGLI